MPNAPDPDDPRDALQRSIGASIRRARDAAGLTQRGLVALVHARGETALTQQHLAQIEKGTINPRAHTMSVLADVLGVPVCSLFGKERPEG